MLPFQQQEGPEGLKEEKGEEKRQTANGEVLCRSSNPSWSPQVDQRQLGDGKGQLGEEKGDWIMGKEGKIRRKKMAFF